MRLAKVSAPGLGTAADMVPRAQVEHNFQTAEGIRAAGYPEWMQLVGLVHDVERRASLAMAYLNLRPGVATCDQLALCLAFVVYESLLALYSAASHVVMAGQGGL